MSSDRREPIRRKNVRYKADPTHSAQITDDLESESFRGQRVALILDESYRGCRLVALKHESFVVGRKLRVQLGDLPPTLAEVRWVVEVDAELVRVGLLLS